MRLFVALIDVCWLGLADFPVLGQRKALRRRLTESKQRVKIALDAVPLALRGRSPEVALETIADGAGQISALLDHEWALLVELAKQLDLLPELLG